MKKLIHLWISEKETNLANFRRGGSRMTFSEWYKLSFEFFLYERNRSLWGELYFGVEGPENNPVLTRAFN